MHKLKPATYYMPQCTHSTNIMHHKETRDVTDSETETESESNKIWHFFQNPKSVGYLKSDHIRFLQHDVLALKEHKM